MQKDGVQFWVLVLYAVVGVACATLAGFGVSGRSEFLVAGLIGLVLTATTAPIALALGSIAAPTEEPVEPVHDDLLELAATIRQLTEQGALSDDARRVINRRRERDLLCAAIEEDISAEDWDAAMVLVKELAERFGYRADAEEFRARIETARYQTVDRRVNDSIKELDRLIMQLRWDEAFAEAGRIVRVHPDSPRVEGLRHRVESARARYKTELERRFLMSAEANRIDEAMELLKELDQYLSQEEAEPYQEVARGVIGKARENLGVQFKLAVQDRRWIQAADVGERVLSEFPNTRMAEEIRGMIDGVRERAAALR